jgi:hypothetical protein
MAERGRRTERGRRATDGVRGRAVREPRQSMTSAHSEYHGCQYSVTITSTSTTSLAAHMVEMPFLVDAPYS